MAGRLRFGDLKAAAKLLIAANRSILGTVAAWPRIILRAPHDMRSLCPSDTLGARVARHKKLTAARGEAWRAKRIIARPGQLSGRAPIRETNTSRKQREITMSKRAVFTVGCTIALSLGFATSGASLTSAAMSAQTSDASMAKAMLEKAVAAVKANETKALDMFNNGEGGFYERDRDIFPFCFKKADGKIVATQTKQALGKDIRKLKDKTGKPFGQEIYNDAKDGRISEVSYKFGKPGAEQTLVPKVSFVTGVADLGCAVGFYK